MAKHKMSIDDLLRRVFEPIEKEKSDGRVVFRTTDRVKYERKKDGSIRRLTPKRG